MENQGEKKNIKSTIFSDLTNCVIGWELLVLIGRPIIICPLSGWPVRTRKRHTSKKFYKQRGEKENVVQPQILTVVCVSIDL